MNKKERLILINQYEILAALKPDEESHYKELIKILSEGYEIFYDTLTEWIDEGMDETKSRFVLDVFDLYRAIHSATLKSEDEKVTQHHLSYFHGFDGNYEAEYLSFARFLVEDQGKFAEQKGYLDKNDSMNSPTEMVHTYRAMLKAHQEIGKSFTLSDEELLRILDAPNG
jgi:uncharacterized protein YfbU (UPF0304 family)